MIESVNLDKVMELAERLTGDNAFALTVYGPVKEKDLKESCKLLQ